MIEDFGAAEDFGAVEDFGDAEDFGPISQKSAKGNLGESAARAGSDFVQAADMIASLPGFALKIGERGMTTLIAALDGADNPLELANKIAEEAYSQGWRKWTMTPIESTLEALGVKIPKEGTVVHDTFQKVGEKVEEGSKAIGKKTGSTELGEAAKQGLDIALLGLGTAAFKAGKPRESATQQSIEDILKQQEPEAKTFTQDPADLFPETLETPYGTLTGRQPGWTVDENGIPVNRQRTSEFQDTELGPLSREMEAPSGETSLGVYARVPEQGTFTPKQDFTLEPRPEVPETSMDLPFEKVDPNSLKETQEGFDWTPTEVIDFGKYATPEQGIEHIQRIPTDITPLKGEIPYQESLGLNASGESAASLEAINRLKSEQTQGISRYKINPETGQITPLITADRVDARAGKGEAIIQVQDGKTTVLENNSRMNDIAVKNRSEQKLGGTGKKGFGQGGSWTPFAGKEKTLEERAKSTPKDKWIAEFNEVYPGKEQFAEQLYTRFKGSDSNFSTPDSLKSIGKSLDRVVTPISTRLGNIHPELKQHLVDFEFYNTKNSGNRLDRVDKFLNDIYTNFPLKEDQAVVKSLLLRNDFHNLEKLSPTEFKGEIKELHNVLDEVGDELVKYGIIENKRLDYFPRIVTDLEGLYKAMGKEDATALQKLLFEKQKGGRPLSDIEQADLVNRYMMGNFRHAGKPGFARGRKLDNIPPEFEKFYAEPAEALHTYLRSATFQIERAKFFGKSAVKNPETKRLDVEQSIGNYVMDLLNKDQITPPQVEEVAGLLRTRFGAGQMQSNAFVQGYKDLTHLALLGDIGNSAMQLADAFIVAAYDGVRPTVYGTIKALNPKADLKAKDFGLMNRLADDFVSDRLTTRAVNKTFKWSGLAKVDEFTKDLILNATMKRGQMEADRPTKNTLYTEVRERFGDEFPQLVEDLKEGKKTELTDRYVISELANRQPIFKSEYSQAYLDNPNSARAAMTLTSFMLKMADFQRVRAFQQIKRGNVAEGAANLGKIALGLTAGGIVMDDVRDWIAGRPVEPLTAKRIAAAYFGTFRMGDYFSDALQKGAFGDAIVSAIAPPGKVYFNDLGKDLVEAFDEDKEFSGKSVKYIPLIGDEIYWRTEQGQEEADKIERRRMREELK